MLLKELFNEGVDRGTGMFSMDDATAISKMTDIQAAQKMAMDIADNSKAKPENVRKAKAMILKANTINKIVLGMGNFILAHIDPKLKVTK